MEVESKQSKALELFALGNDDTAMLAKILLNINIVHQGRIISLQDECFWVWDMGSELTFCNSLLEDEGLLPAAPGPRR